MFKMSAVGQPDKIGWRRALRGRSCSSRAGAHWRLVRVPSSRHHPRLRRWVRVDVDRPFLQVLEQCQHILVQHVQGVPIALDRSGCRLEKLPALRLAAAVHGRWMIAVSSPSPIAASIPPLIGIRPARPRVRSPSTRFIQTTRLAYASAPSQYRPVRAALNTVLNA
jgi:hypothetical protein